MNRESSCLADALGERSSADRNTWQAVQDNLPDGLLAT